MNVHTYRLAVEQDAEEVLEVTLRAYEPVRELGIHFAAATADLDLVKKNIRDNICYIREKDGRIQATLSLRMPWGKQPGPYGVPHIWWFAVDPLNEEKRIGTAFMEWIETEILSKQFKAPAVSLGTADSHPWLAEMYERKGYIRAGQADLGKGHLTVYLMKPLLPHLLNEQQLTWIGGES
ncbi:GNAT family N-acetyltransferase [Planococcus sp. 1R117A]|uniref:GNAT family N-acetyltransferase n=1 Tax=Planococcus sp. 1R117A TaxID=3447020 RepID=UPI003EDBD34B